MKCKCECLKSSDKYFLRNVEIFRIIFATKASRCSESYRSNRMYNTYICSFVLQTNVFNMNRGEKCYNMKFESIHIHTNSALKKVFQSLDNNKRYY